MGGGRFFEVPLFLGGRPRLPYRSARFLGHFLKSTLISVVRSSDENYFVGHLGWVCCLRPFSPLGARNGKLNVCLQRHSLCSEPKCSEPVQSNLSSGQSSALT